MPVKIFATGTRRRRSGNAINPKGCFVRQAARHTPSQAVGPVGQSIWLITCVVCVCVGQRGRNAALIVHPALLGDTNRDGVVAPGTVGELHCLVGC